MNSTIAYSLAEIDQFLPITNRIAALRWLKEQYEKAKDAMEYGFEGATVMQKGDVVVTAEEITQLIDVRHGRIGQRGAQLLIRIVQGGLMPAALVVNGKDIDPDFYRYAFPSKE